MYTESQVQKDTRNVTLRVREGQRGYEQLYSDFPEVTATVRVNGSTNLVSEIVNRINSNPKSDPQYVLRSKLQAVKIVKDVFREWSRSNGETGLTLLECKHLVEAMLEDDHSFKLWQ